MKYLLIQLTGIFTSFLVFTNYSYGQEVSTFSNGGVSIDGFLNNDVSNRPRADLESFDFTWNDKGNWKNPLHVSLKHSVSSFNISSDNLQENLIGSIGSQLVTQTGGTFYLSMRQKNNGNINDRLGWYYDLELNGGIIPFNTNKINPDENSTGITKTNLFFDGAIEWSTGGKKGDKSIDFYIVLSGLLGFSHVFTNGDENHIFYQMYQDDRGNKANPTGFTYNLELSLIVSDLDLAITIGTLGRQSFGKGVSDAHIFGLQPRGYVSFESAF